MLLIHKGLQDKLIATGGYCIMNTDEGIGFLDNMTKKEASWMLLKPRVTSINGALLSALLLL